MLAGMLGASIVALAIEVAAVSATFGAQDWAAWRRGGLGWRPWMDLGDRGRWLATASLVAAIASIPQEGAQSVRWIVAIDLLAILMSMLVPAVAARA